jgi:hypothetical protein
MAFVAEDGTGMPTATSLVSLAYADAYWDERPLTAGAWATATDPQKQEALQAASRWLDGYSFLGSPLRGDQALALPRYWPTIGGRSYDGMPTRILEAVCELAMRHLTTPLGADLERGGEIQNETLGPLSTTYFPGAPGSTLYPWVDGVKGLIRPFLDGGSGQLEAILC